MLNPQAQAQATERIAAIGRLEARSESLLVELDIQRRQ